MVALRSYRPGELVLVRAKVLEYTYGAFAGNRAVAMLQISDGPEVHFTVTTFAPVTELVLLEGLVDRATGCSPFPSR